MPKTVESLFIELDELKQKIAIKKALAGFLRTRYMSRDGLPPQSTIAYDRSVVTEDVVFEIVGELEKESEDMETAVQAFLQETLDD